MATEQAKPDGGPAFPQTEYYDEQPIGAATGMTLRDYFAAQALSGIANGGTAEVFRMAKDAGVRPMRMAAQIAYEFADAMLAERAK